MTTDHSASSSASLTASELPDVGSGVSPTSAVALESVGMQGIVLPLTMIEGATAQVAARVDAAVSLEAGGSRGIHMSRLYRLAGEILAGETLSAASLHKLLQAFLDSHSEFADRARVRIRFELLLKRSALLSGGSGWHAYPVEIDAELARSAQQCQIRLGCSVTYSSTCPASAALARQAIQQAFAGHFVERGPIPLAEAVAWLGSEAGVPATPHSQRSEAKITVELASLAQTLPMGELIDVVEHALATPVQTAVKREDEQEFARLNARNTMFCEDAARRIHQALDGDDRYADFRIRASHFESLHAHDAVAVAVKGIGGGFRD